jgi:hypothetical protein
MYCTDAALAGKYITTFRQRFSKSATYACVKGVLAFQATGPSGGSLKLAPAEQNLNTGCDKLSLLMYCFVKHMTSPGCGRAHASCSR